MVQNIWVNGCVGGWVGGDFSGPPYFQDHRAKFNIVSPVLEIELSPAGDIDQTQHFSESSPGALSRVGCPCELFSASRSCLPVLVGIGWGEGLPRLQQSSRALLAELSFPPPTPPSCQLLAIPFPACHTAVLPTSLPDYLSSGFLEQMFSVPSCIKNKQALCVVCSPGENPSATLDSSWEVQGGLWSLSRLPLARNLPPVGWQRLHCLLRCVWPFQAMGGGSKWDRVRIPPWGSKDGPHFCPCLPDYLTFWKCKHLTNFGSEGSSRALSLVKNLFVSSNLTSKKMLACFLRLVL